MTPLKLQKREEGGTHIGALRMGASLKLFPLPGPASENVLKALLKNAATFTEH